MRNSTPELTTIALLISGLFCCSASAESISWIAADGFWDVASNWDSAALPTSASDVGISFSSAPHTVTHNRGDDTISTLTTNGNAKLLVNGVSTLSISSGGTNAGIIGVANARLNLNGGALTNTGGILSADVGGTIALNGVNLVGGTLNSTGTGKFIATSNVGNFLNGVVLNGALDLTTTANSRERIINGAAINGEVNIANGGILSLDSYVAAASQTIGGSAKINLNDAGARLALEGSGTTTLGANVVVRGQGNIGQAAIAGGNNTLINQGLISADVIGTLNITPGAGGGSVVNQGILQASNGGLLLLSTGISNTAAQILAQNGSTVRQNGVTVSGGAIGTSGTGTFQATSSSTNFLDAVNFTGKLDLTSLANSRERIINGATINGAIDVANGGVLTLDSYVASPSQALSGTVAINLNDAGARLAIDGGGTTTLASGVTVRGQGNIGGSLNAGGANVLTSNGLISSDVSGGTLSITAPGGSGSFINNGTLQAVGGGTLLLSTNIHANAGSQIISGAGSAVVQNGVTINGDFKSSGGGSFSATSSSANFLDAVNFTGTLDLTSLANSRERIINGATINGAIDVAHGGVLSLDNYVGAPSQALSGTVAINLNDAGAKLAIDGGGTTTLASSVTVRGQGNIGGSQNAGGANVLTSNGLISSDVSGGTLSITAPGGSGSFINNGTLQAVGGGTLLLSTNIHANAGSQIISGAGSAVVQNGVTINGVFTSSGGGSFSATSSGANFLDAVNFTGTLDLTSVANSRERIINGATINGAIDVANGGVLSLDSYAGAANQTIGGTVMINLNDAGARLAIEGSGSTTLASTVVVRGQGNIGGSQNAGGANVLTSNGLISSDVNGGTLSITAPGGSGSFINNGTLQAVGGATLLLSTSINNAGQIIAGAGSTVVQNGVTLNGVIDASGSAVFKATSSGANFLNGVDFKGNLDLSSIANSREQIINGATIKGVVNVAGGGILSLNGNLTAGGSQTLAGMATINLNDVGAQLSIDGSGSTILSSGITVRGQGNIGQAAFAGGTNVLTNNGLISADVDGGTLSITTPAGSGSFINNATVQAIGGGRLALSSNIDNAGGLISVQNGSSAVLSGVTLSGGTLATGGTGVFQAISSGANVLSSVTLDGSLDMTTIANSREQIINGMVLNGAINVANGGILSLNSASTTIPSPGNQTISGTGVINLNDAGARLAIEGSGSTTLAAGITVRGQGNIGQAAIAGGTNTLINNGTILADGGTLTIVSPANSGSLAGTGTLQASGGTLNLSSLTSPIAQGRLVIGGGGSALTMGTQNLTISSDYTNAQGGTGNSFNARAGVSGTGQILAGNGAAQVIAGSNISSGSTTNATLMIGNVHVGANSFSYQINDSSASGPILRGAIQTSVNGGNLSDSRLSGTGVAASNYSSSNGPLAVTYTATSAGTQTALSGQVLNLTSNFANIADQKLNIVLGGGAAAYNLATGSAGSVAVANQRVGGAATGALTVSNTAPNSSFTEALNASFAGSAGQVTRANGAITGGTGFGVAGGASNAAAMTVGIDTLSAGAKSGAVTLNYVSNGTGSSGLGNTAVGSQMVSVTGNVYQIARPDPLALPATVSLGNFRAGSGAQSQTINLANTNAAPAGFQEGLAAIVQGTVGTAAGTGFANAAAGTSGALQVGLSGISAGLNSGAVQVQLQSNGITTGGSNGLGSLDLGGVQTVNVTGTGWRLASANTLGAVTFGNVHVGDTVQQALNIVNTAAADGYSEKLNASFGASSDARITTSGSISQLAAGSGNSGMVVGLNTSAAGTVSGTQVVKFASDGTGTSGLGLTDLASQIIGVSGDITTSGSVYRLASASAATPNPVNFGNVRIGTVADQAVSIGNTAADDGFSEKLNASITSDGSPVIAGGSFTLLAAQSTDSSHLHVGIDTSSAGAKSGSATIALVSDGTGTSGLAPTTLASQTVNVSGDVYRLANAQNVTPSITLAARVGDAALSGNVSITNQSPDKFTEALKVEAGAAPSGFAVGANPANIAAQGTGVVQVSLNTATAGRSTGDLTLKHLSTGAGTTGATDQDVGSSVVALVGKVYTAAIGAVQSVVDFGIVHVGDVIAQGVSVQNVAPVTALNDTLSASIGGATGPFTSNKGSVAGLTAGGAADATALVVGLNTMSAGVFTGAASVGLASANPDLKDLALGGQTVALNATVNNYANALFDKVAGAGSLTRVGNQFILDFGTVVQGSGKQGATLDIENAVAGPADLLNGRLALLDGNDFASTLLLSGFSGVDAGGSSGDALSFLFDSTVLGSFQDEVSLSWFGDNASGYRGEETLYTLLVRGNVTSGGGMLPEPQSFALFGIALAALALSRRRRPALA